MKNKEYIKKMKRLKQKGWQRGSKVPLADLLAAKKAVAKMHSKD